MAYEYLAPHYDSLMTGLDYQAYADYLLSFSDREPEGLRVLDLACGTGRLSEELCRRGCDVAAVDASADMLNVAHGRGCGALYIQQDMTELDLYGTVEAAFCTLDALNYLTSPKQLKKTFTRVKLFLEPGGVFVFDMLTPGALSSRDGMVYMSDSEEAYCVWKCSWREPFCRQEMTLFTREGSLWRRRDETHTERAFELSAVGEMLVEAGFSSVERYGFMKKDPSGADAERVVFAAK